MKVVVAEVVKYLIETIGPFFKFLFFLLSWVENIEK